MARRRDSTDEKIANIIATAADTQSARTRAGASAPRTVVRPSMPGVTGGPSAAHNGSGTVGGLYGNIRKDGFYVAVDHAMTKKRVEAERAAKASREFTTAGPGGPIVRRILPPLIVNGSGQPGVATSAAGSSKADSVPSRLIVNGSGQPSGPTSAVGCSKAESVKPTDTNAVGAVDDHEDDRRDSRLQAAAPATGCLHQWHR